MEGVTLSDPGMGARAQARRALVGTHRMDWGFLLSGGSKDGQTNQTKQNPHRKDRKTKENIENT